MTITIGLTGGIGSGKSHIAKAFSILGIPTYNADKKAKQIIKNNENLKKHLIRNFGKNIFNEKGLLQKKLLAEIIYKNKSKLQLLNSLVHPLVWQDFENWILQQNSVPYVVKESAILIETDLYKKFNFIILVISPLHLRMKRLLKHKQYNKKNIINIMNNQLPENTKQKYADFVLINDEKELLIPQILFIHKEILKFIK